MQLHRETWQPARLRSLPVSSLGLFTGPNYTILKSLTVIKLAKALDAMGVPAVPVFWIAAEDHDYQEIESASVLDRDSEDCSCSR